MFIWSWMHRYKRFGQLSLARFFICIGYLYPGTNAPSQARRGLLQPTQYRCLTIAPGGGSNRYQSQPLPSTNVSTFVPACVLARYKCATAIIASSFLCPRPPPHYFSFSLNASYPSPMELLPNLRRFVHDFTHWSGIEVSYFILPWHRVAILSIMFCTQSISLNLE
jgi:hypothetical protein